MGMMDRFRIPTQVHARRFEDELVVLDLREGKYFALDAVGSVIWDELTTGKTPEETAATLVATFDVSESTANADVHRLADELLAVGLLERRT
jgi:Coenzyme PQQ synthesis protein D (PqqD)